MDQKLIALGLAASMLVTAVAPLYTSASDYSHMSMSHSMQAHGGSFGHYLISQGYYTEGADIRERRMGIMKFQRESGIRETGSMNVDTRIALRKAMNLPNIVSTGVATPILSTLVTAVQTAGLVETLSGEGPFTVFAPTNDAFAKLPAETLAALLTPEKKADLTSILTFHVVSGKAFSGELKDGQEIPTVQGKTLKVKITDGKVYINGAQVVLADVKTKNGVVHVIDTVLLP